MESIQEEAAIHRYWCLSISGNTEVSTSFRPFSVHYSHQNDNILNLKITPFYKDIRISKLLTKEDQIHCKVTLLSIASAFFTSLFRNLDRFIDCTRLKIH